MGLGRDRPWADPAAQWRTLGSRAGPAGRDGGRRLEMLGSRAKAPGTQQLEEPAGWFAGRAATRQPLGGGRREW